MYNSGKGIKDYDPESGLYYMGGGYYSPVMKSFISACNINEKLYNIDVPGSLNSYAIGNSMYFPVNGYNIFTSIPLVPEIKSSDDWWGKFWQDVWDWSNTIAGVLNPNSTITAIGAVGVAMIQGRWDDLAYDWNNGSFNPVNQNADVALNSKVVSFYKGSTVVKQDIVGTCSIFGTIWLKGNNREIDLKHEWGHSVQERILGFPLYAISIAVPSVINYNRDLNGKLKRDYYSYPWERTADWLGGVSESERIMHDGVGYDENSLLWGILYLIGWGLI